MREGPPPWLHPQTLAKSPQYEAGDSKVIAEIWAEGIRILAEGYQEDDAEYDCESATTYFSLEECVCLCNTLATGKDTRFVEEAWGRVYERVFSVDAPGSAAELDPRRQNIWFYPMNERRMTFRLPVRPLIPALQEMLQWAEHEAPRVQATVQGAQNRQLRRALELLGNAKRRVG